MFVADPGFFRAGDFVGNGGGPSSITVFGDVRIVFESVPGFVDLCFGFDLGFGSG